MRKFILTLILSGTGALGFSQGSCASPLNLGTPNATQSCQTISNGTTGSAPCAGAGYGGNSGGVTYLQFCTNGNADCVNFTFSNGTTSGNWAAYVYTSGCFTAIDGKCMGTTGSGASISTANMGLSPNTCYTMRVWSAGAGTFTVCAQTMTPTEDGCSGAVAIGPNPQALNNYCTTPGSNTAVSPAVTPGQLCAGSLENTAWYSFTVLNSGDVVITIDNIICSGGGAGFQIGAYTGNCGALNNIGCTSGSGGTVTLTITGLTAGQVVYIAIDGNAGANCTYDMSATNTVSLPVELLSFSAESINNAFVELGWVTASEVNNDYFTIERSVDGVSYEVIGIIDGAGNSTMMNEYSTEDMNPHKGVSYYRLKQTDYDGEYTYSRTVPVEVKGSIQEISVFPNPIEGQGHVSFHAGSAGSVTLSIIDVMGRVVAEQVMLVTSGNNTTVLNTENLTQGMYFLTIGNEVEKEQVKFIKN